MRITTSFIAALSFAVSACNFCGADEERAVTISSPDSLAITLDAQTRWHQFVTRVADAQINASDFDAVFDALEREGSSNRAVVVTLSGAGATPADLITIVLALPADMERGDRYTIGSVFTAQPGLSTDPGMWGTRTLISGNTAEIGFTKSTYTFPPATHTINFRALTATGTIDVVSRSNGHVELDLAIQLKDAEGKNASLSGRVQGSTERYTPPCFS